jgi:hypothetical protein
MDIMVPSWTLRVDHGHYVSIMDTMYMGHYGFIVDAMDPSWTLWVYYKHYGYIVDAIGLRSIVDSTGSSCTLYVQDNFSELCSVADTVETVPVTVNCVWSETVDCVGHCGLCGTLWTVRDSVDCAGLCGLCGTPWTVPDTVDCAGHCGLCGTL